MTYQRAWAVSSMTPNAEPRILWGLNGLPVDTALRLERWIDRLAELPLSEWLEVGKRCLRDDRAVLATTRACSRVERAIVEHELQVMAWMVRDLVETSVWNVRRAVDRAPRGVQCQVAIARMAAEWAALAIATEPWIHEDDFATLCSAFTTIDTRDRDGSAGR